MKTFSIKQFFNQISGKIISLTLLISILCCASVGGLNYLNSRSALVESAKNGMSGLVRSRNLMVQNHLKTIEQELALSSANTLTVNAFEGIASALVMRIDIPAIKKYFFNESLTREQRIGLTGKGQATLYTWKHEEIHPYFAKLVTVNHLGDVYLINPKGEVVYSVSKEKDYFSMINKVKPEVSGLAKVFRMISQEGVEQAYVPFAPYEYGNGKYSAFLARKVIKEAEGKKTTVGYMVLRLSDETFRHVIMKGISAQQDGHLYLIDETMKTIISSNGVFDIEPALKMIDKSQETGFFITGASGANNYFTYETLPFLQSRWTVLVRQNEDQVLGPVYSMRNLTVLFTLLTLTVMFGVGLWFARSLARPIEKLVSAMGLLSKGTTDIDLKGMNRADEIGDMFRAVGTFRDNEIERFKLVGRSEEEQKARLLRQQTIESLIETFQQDVAQSLQSVSQNAEMMQVHATSVSESAGESSERAVLMDSSTRDALDYVRAASQAGDEMNSAISEIETQVYKTKDLVNVATSQAQQTDERVSSLSESANKIGEIITIIQEIAEQTNLLALNATIEAARAGDSGKGFAVVAAEVKGLANQTAKATEEIGSQIADIQTETAGSVEAIQSVAEKISEINDYTSAIASAIEEQGAATSEIARNVQSTADKTEEVSSNVHHVASSIKKTDATANEVLVASNSVNQQADKLKSVIDSFLEGVRAA